MLIAVPCWYRLLYSNAGQTDKFKEALAAATSTGVPWAMSMTRRRQDVMDKKEVRDSRNKTQRLLWRDGGGGVEYFARSYAAVRSVNEVLLVFWRYRPVLVSALSPLSL